MVVTYKDIIHTQYMIFTGLGVVHLLYGIRYTVFVYINS